MRRFGWVTVVAIVALAACSSSGSKSKGATRDQLAVSVVSSRPDMVTGESAVLELGGSGVPEVTVDGRALRLDPVRKWWRVSDVPRGASTLRVQRGGLTGSVQITDFPITGPVFSGPHLPLLVCSTEGLGLGPPTDDDCSAPTKVDYLGRDASGLKPLTDPKVLPAGVRQVKRDGKSVPFVVRRERGVINRSVYWIDVLDPGRSADPAKITAWNGRLVYRFGGGCGTSFGQGGTMTTAEAEEFLGAGYAVATATFNTFQTQCNDVLSAETAMMVKSHFVNEFGVPVHTIGEGASGGAIQQHLMLQNYPGILDASLAILPFPDALSISPGVADCGLLGHYYGTGAGSKLSGDQRAAINGHAVPLTCLVWSNSFLEGIRPSDGCDDKIPKSKIYDATSNPKGLRCDLVDANVNQLGRDPKTGFAQRPLDNIGVQYGLRALAEKAITVDEFLDLNASIGGYDVDGNVVPERTTASEDALKLVYGKGRISVGGGDQKVVPIVDLNVYDDPAGDIHDRFRAFSLRDRLRSPNQVIWTRGSAITSINDVIGNIISGGGGAGMDGVAILDRWLDTGKMPAGAGDNCPGANGTFITGLKIYDESGPCRDSYPLHGDPRTAAGEPRRDDILKCQLKPITPTDYNVKFTAAQQTRLSQIFPQGVCDWTKPGVGVVPLEGTWLRY